MDNIRKTKYQGNILIVDDKPDNLTLLSSLLAEQDYKVRCAIDASTALKAVQAWPPDLILLDINMPGMNGYEVCEQLKSDAQTADIPVIFISARDDAFDKVKAFDAGGVDYITKPFEMVEVLARIENQLTLQAAKSEVQKLNTDLEQRVIQRTAQLEAEITERQRAQERLNTTNQGLKAEIVKRQRIQEQLLHMAMHDTLTDLPNRAWFMQQLHRTLSRVKQQPDYQFAVLFLDCDRFKVVNDSLGHLVGDQLLVAVARRLEASLPPGSTLARLGGDEYTVLLEAVNGLEDAIQIVQKLQQELSLPFQLEQYEVFINACFGIVLGNDQYAQPEHLLRDADTAMYQAKALGKARYQVFDPDMHNRALETLKFETSLRWALERQEFVVHYQPIISLATGAITGFEALLRWYHPQYGFLSPAEFIPAAEDTGLIIPSGAWVLREACAQMQTWQQIDQAIATTVTPTTLQTKDLEISVNFSVKQFTQPNLIEQVDRILQETGLPSQSLKLEITESAILGNAEAARQILEQLQSRQIKLAIDDFGTGYSSLSYLHRFPVDTLKIDQSFVDRLTEGEKDRQIVQAIIDLAHTLGMEVVAEGIETKQQLLKLKAMGCDLGQGYFFSKPLDQGAARAILNALPNWA